MASFSGGGLMAKLAELKRAGAAGEKWGIAAETLFF